MATTDIEFIYWDIAKETHHIVRRGEQPKLPNEVYIVAGGNIQMICYWAQGIHKDIPASDLPNEFRVWLLLEGVDLG